MCIYIYGFSWYFHGKQKKFHMNFNDPGIEQVCITTVQFGNYVQTLCSSLFDGAASFSKPKWAVYRTIASEKNIQSAGVTTVFEKKQKLKFHTDTPQLPKGGNKSVFGYSPHCDYMSVFLFTRWKTDYLKSLHCPIWACACGHVLYLRIYVPYACISSWCAMKTLHISQERSCLRVYIHMNSWPFFLLFIWCSLSSCSAHWSKAGNKHSTAWNSPTTRIQRTEVANLEGFLKTHCGSILHSVNH